MKHRFLDPEIDLRTPGPVTSNVQRLRTAQFSPRPEGSEKTMPAEYLDTLRRYRLSILLFGIVGSLLMFLANISTMPMYRTRTSLDIRSLNNDFMNMHAVAPTSAGGGAEGDIDLQTQIKLLQSDTLLEQVAEQLLAQPHPETIERRDLLSRAEVAFHLRSTDPLPFGALLQNAVENVKVKPLGATRLVEVTCDAWDGKFSALFCNTLVQTYEQQDLQTRATEAQKTSEWLTRQLADVRQRAEDSQKKLEEAVGGNGLMLSQTSTSTGEDRLRSLQEELVKAQADRMEQQARASVSHAVSPETLPSVQDNPAHRAYEIKVADLRSRVAELVPPLTELNPKVIHLRSEIAEAEAGLLATQSSSTQREDNEYTASRHREELLRIAYRAQETLVSNDLQKSAQVSLLRRELDSEQQLYQTLLQRAKEAGFASAMQAATIRVIDLAKAPFTPFSPRRGLSSIAGLAIGSLFGVGFAFFKERTHKVFRAPGEVRRNLDLQELGVIPTAKKISQPLITRSRTTSILKHGNAEAERSEGEAITLTRWTDSFSIAAEAYRNATLSILLAESGKHTTRSYVVSSPSSGEGKTTVASNLGIALSKSKLRVALIDGDLRRPALHHAFAVSNRFGLRDILRGDVDLDRTLSQRYLIATQHPNISIVPAGEGSEDVVELLHSPQVQLLMNRLSKDFDVILIDTPPVLHMADARILAGHTDGAILVIRAGRTARDRAANARDLFDHDGVRLVGAILNDFDPESNGNGNYYESYYRYYQKRSEPEKVGSAL